VIRLSYTQYHNYFVCHVDNLQELNIQTLKALEHFAHERSGDFDYIKESFRIPKRIELHHLLELFRLKGLDVFITLKQAQNLYTNTSTINFGKFKGTKWSELDVDYLQWLSQNLQGNGRQTAIDELNRRKQQHTTSEKKQPSCLHERIDFGKHKGKEWGTLPQEYLEWVAGNLQGYAASCAFDTLEYLRK
jgi:uncharacterized protein (DUF3820 family)